MRLTYTPRNPRGHVALVGKGVMYDSGGISLKPSGCVPCCDENGYVGAAAVLSTMTALKDAKPQSGNGLHRALTTCHLFSDEAWRRVDDAQWQDR